MGRNGYRDGVAQVNVVLDPELRDRMRAKAQRNGRSLSEETRLAWLSWLGEEVEDDERDAGPGRGRAAVAGERGPRPVSGVGGEDHARVGAGDVAVPLIGAVNVPFDWDALEREQGGVSLSALVDRSLPARRDSRGKAAAPIIVDEWIDTA